MVSRLALFAVLAAVVPAQGTSERSKPTVIRMATLVGLRYEFARFDVKPGVEVELVIENRDAMMHNLVITKPGKRLKVVMQAAELGLDAVAMNFVSKSADVLWSVGVLKPGETKRLRFKAPATPGEYPYVCTYPGHGFVMFGSMVVTDHPKPPVKSVLVVPNQPHHHGAIDRIILRRMFMPDAGPASIAVSQPDGRSYCWDAGACRLRYVWAGGPIFKVKMGKAPQLTGPLLYRETVGFPLRIGSDPGQRPRRVRYCGYRLDAAGEPEFEYDVDGVNVRERITVSRGKVQRTFRTDSRDETIWFAHAADVTPVAEPQGRIRKGESGLPSYIGFGPGQGRAFTIAIAYRDAGAAQKGDVR